MRRISSIPLVLSVIFLLKGHVHGYASAPGTYPEEETKAGNDMEMPKNPYQNGWTGYDFYYEKEPKSAPVPGGSGKMPAFQSIEEVSTDRESPEDPVGYQASGSETGPKKHTTKAPVTPSEKVMVSPSTSTKGSTKSVTTTMSTTMSTTTTVPTTITTEPPHAPIAPEKDSEKDPEGGSDLSAADNLEFLYGGGPLEGNMEKKKDPITSTVPPAPKITPPPSHYDPPPPPPASPKNLLTKLFEKKTSAPKLGTSEDSSGPSGYDTPSMDSHESGYGPGTTMKSSKWSSRGQAPGAEPMGPGTIVVQKLDQGYDQTDQVITTMAPTARQTTVADHSSSDGYSNLGGPSVPITETSKSTKPAPETPKVPNPLPGTYINPGGYSDQTTQSPIPSRGYSNPGAYSNPGSFRRPNTPSPISSRDYNNPESYNNPGSFSSSTTQSPESSRDYKTYSSLSNYLGAAPPIPKAHGYKPSVSESQGDAYSNPEVPIDDEYSNPSHPRGNEPKSQGPQDGYINPSVPKDHGYAPGSEPSIPGNSGYPDVLDYGARPNNHFGKAQSKTTVPQEESYSNSNNAIAPRDPYDHFGNTAQHPTLAPSAQFKHNTHGNFEEEVDEMDGGYGNNDVVIVPLRSTPTTKTTNTEVRAQISEIDRIAESFENSAREPVEYEQKITSESSKGITVEAGKDVYKHLGRKSRKCCSCCNEKQSVNRNIETKVEPLHVQQAVDPSRQLAGERDPVENYVPLQSTVGGSAYVQQPAVQPPQTNYQQPFQQYQPQYPQSYSYQQPSCGCQPQPQNCCAPPAPCCLPTIPCCPPIPCCPQPKICCQPTPICLPPQQCCSINFKLPTIPICGRACPSCPCRRRVHKSLRLKRHAISSNCHQCSSAGEPWKSVLHHREKRAAPGCSSGFSTMQQNSCGTCGASHLRSTRVKRMGCLPCLGRKKRDTEENSHIRVKRMGCLPCLGRKKRSALSSSSGCSQCNSLGHLFNRYKRSLFGCSPCAPQPPCGCQGRKKRSITMKVFKRAPEQCDATCCDYSRCLHRQKKETLVPFM